MADTETTLQMPSARHWSWRDAEFELLAEHAGCNGHGGSLALRSWLSNLFVAMTGLRRAKGAS